MMERFFNAPEKVVTQAMDGVLRLTGRLSRANAFPFTKFVMREDWDQSKVAIVSGGGAGHEPAHIGFVGQGMLTAAVSGEVFASPSVEAILACILQVTGEAGCLLIVKNYTGDRLNFGLAAERAKKMGKKVDMLIVSDDIALPDAPQPRGIAGTLFVHKVAGYLAEQGCSLEEIKTQANQVAEDTQSLGLAIATCALPGAPQYQNSENSELGLGIHGEPGLEKVTFANGREAVGLVLSRLFAKTEKGKKYALLINNLGAVTPLEMAIITNEILTSKYQDQIQLVIGPALLMTSLNMYGFSLSLLKLTEERITMLQAEVAPPAWPGAIIPQQPKLVDISQSEFRRSFESSSNPKVREVIEAICQHVLAAEQRLNELDKKVGDGDTGSTFALGARGLMDAMAQTALPLDNTAHLLLAIGDILASKMGGSSGVLLSIFFTNAGTSFIENSDLVESFRSGIAMMMKYGGAKMGSRTMLDALQPAVETLRKHGVPEAALAARKGANATALMEKADSGRSAYLRGESLKGITDPGAEAVAIIFEALLSAKSVTLKGF